MSRIPDLESKIAESRKVLDFYTNELNKTNLPAYLRQQYEQAINSQTNKINVLENDLENEKRNFGNLSLQRPPANSLPYQSNGIMPRQEFISKFGDPQIYNNEMMPTTPNSASSPNSFMDTLKSWNPFASKGGASMSANNKKLLASAKRGDISAVNELLSTTKNVNINVKDKAGNTPIMIAVQNSDSPMTHVLMSYHATVNQATISKLNKNKSAFFRKRLMPTFKKYMKMTNKMAKKMNTKTRKHRR
jgi:hypothetical protein